MRKFLNWLYNDELIVNLRNATLFNWIEFILMIIKYTLISIAIYLILHFNYK